jgi:hypothetical protein
MMQRDFSSIKKELFDEMSGNSVDLNDPTHNPTIPGVLSGLEGHPYPSAYYTEDTLGADPSIRGKAIYIP